MAEKSRQQKYREKQKLAGNCVQCGLPARRKRVAGKDVALAHCEGCAEDQKKRIKSARKANRHRRVAAGRSRELTVRQAALRVARICRKSPAGTGVAAGVDAFA